MKILMVHNEYKSKGGEDTVLTSEINMLKKMGNEVILYIESNSNINQNNKIQMVKTGINTIWSVSSFKKFRKILAELKPDIIHVHNTFPIISPSIYKAAKVQKIPLVQTLHNYRLVCSNGLLLKNGLPCEKCVGKKIPFESLKNRCYKDSLTGTFAINAMQVINKSTGNYNKNVDAYICLTEFAKNIMVRDGFPKEKLFVKPNFLNEDNSKLIENNLKLSPEKNNNFVFVGRVSKEKGINDILEAFEEIDQSSFSLTIIGDGPEKSILEEKYGNNQNIIWKGWIENEKVKEEIAKNNFLVMGSKWYEGFPMVLLEAMSLGKPVIVPNHAGFPEIVTSETGMLFKPNDIKSLKNTLQIAINQSEFDFQNMSIKSKEIFKLKYTSKQNYSELLEIYQSAINGKDGR
ncbi:glycosyltransferase family 4 protein [Exiguobacterium sp. ZWU0009]|uniref:glycosyltransferase family 4 protein n=1 Tax=Exiguobacterium sp. ZWU0009 TaxID=1224749 RepID=UPI001314E7E4|nr:glycosyltransferase family 4 protein [Exiguobacterium sp. ZWU0009]